MNSVNVIEGDNRPGDAPQRLVTHKHAYWTKRDTHTHTHTCIHIHTHTHTHTHTRTHALSLTHSLTHSSTDWFKLVVSRENIGAGGGADNLSSPQKLVLSSLQDFVLVRQLWKQVLGAIIEGAFASIHDIVNFAFAIVCLFLFVWSFQLQYIWFGTICLQKRCSLLVSPAGPRIELWLGEHSQDLCNKLLW